MSKEELERRYKEYLSKTKYPGGDTLPKVEFMYHDSSILSQEEFIDKIKTDDEFAKKWGENENKDDGESDDPGTDIAIAMGR